MSKSIEEYLELLKNELRESDSATIQDALADAEEHLRAAVTSLREKQPETSEANALDQVIDQYGSPEETAAAYKEVERRTSRKPEEHFHACPLFWSLCRFPCVGRIALHVDRVCYRCLLF